MMPPYLYGPWDFTRFSKVRLLGSFSDLNIWLGCGRLGPRLSAGEISYKAVGWFNNKRSRLRYAAKDA